MCDLVHQINSLSCCATPSCRGKLKPVSVSLAGEQGGVVIQFDCTGCVRRRVCFNSTVEHEFNGYTVVGLALQVAFICSGAMYSQYARVLRDSLGMYCARKTSFYRTIELMYPHVKEILDEMCSLAKESMKSMDSSVLGSYDNAVTCGDAAWLT